jgi:hypothetical protein
LNPLVDPALRAGATLDLFIAYRLGPSAFYAAIRWM